jgi:hypothetical protein
MSLLPPITGSRRAAAGWLLALAAPLAAQSVPDSLASLAPTLPFDGVDGGSGTALPAELDDALPLPVPPSYAASDDGDVRLAPASGDPYFLGFAAGSYYPPADEDLDPELVAALAALPADGRPAQESYAFVLFSKRITGARVAQVEALGARALGFHPHHALKVALAPGAEDALAALDFVRWVGLPRAWQKVHPALAAAVERAGAGPVEVYVDVFDSDLNPASEAIPLAAPVLAGGGVAPESAADAAVRWSSNGWQQRALEQLGLEVVEYVDSIRAFRARMHPALLPEVVALDFVQFVEPDGEPQPTHDESMAMILSDSTRATWDGGANSAAVMGFADSGYHSQHLDLNGAWGVGWDLANSGGPYVDLCGHGSHVLGTIRGEGDVIAGYRGSARGLGWGPSGRIFAVKVFDDGCSWGGTSLATILDRLDSPYFDGMVVTPRPHVCNHSWGTPGGPFVGSEASPRTIDNAVYDDLQLHVWAAGNDGPSASTIHLEASSKNALTIGSVIDYHSGSSDPGEISSFSGRGPCADGRWKPNLVAPGQTIRSVGNLSTTTYALKSGTSMAAPHVTGVAAQLCDRYSWLRYAPHRLANLLMSTAMTRADQALTTPSTGSTATHLRAYGTGRVEAYRAHNSTSQMNWTNSGWDQNGSQWVYGDFSIAAGCTRLVVCVTYHEPASSSGASKALVNDFDLYIDGPSGGIDPGGNTGEYFAHQSALDNTEIRTINNPPAGAWRFKVWPESVPGTAHVSATVVEIYGDTTPDGTLSVTVDDSHVLPGDDVTFTATVTNPSFVASAVFLDSSSTGDTLQSSSTTLLDGVVTDLRFNPHGGRDVLVGDIVHGAQRAASWTTRWTTEGIWLWTVEGRSDNWAIDSDYASVTVDGTPPGVATNLVSTTHTPGVWSNQTHIVYTWDAAPDNLSNVDGYGISAQPAPTIPVAEKDLEELPLSYQHNLPSGTWYFNLRAVDYCGNWATGYASAGPFRIDLVPPSGPANLASATHTLGLQSCSTDVETHWSAASDAGSGLAGYLGVWNTQAVFDPTGAPNLAPSATSVVTDVGSTNAARWFHLRAKDVAGSYGPTLHLGPIYANSSSVATYCTAKTNSLGCAPAISSFGTPSIGGGGLTVTCAGVVNNKAGLLFWGYTPAATPFQDGWKCVASPTLRTPVLNSGGAASGNSCTGSYAFVFDPAYMNQWGIDPGDTVHAQWWMRDPGAASTTGLSNAIQFTVCE